MDGLGSSADHTGRAVGNRFVVNRWKIRTGERSSKSRGVVRLVHDEAVEVVFHPLLV